MFGNLTFSAFIHGPIETIPELMVIFGALFVVGLLFYTKRWGWLWREWLTTLDHKKIGVMYIILSFVMLMRGAADAFMMRAQQTLAVAPSCGLIYHQTTTHRYLLRTA
jgi:cytochrome o ubiquinol oxidase subunit 1